MEDIKISARNYEFARVIEPAARELLDNHIKNRKPWNFYSLTTSKEMAELIYRTPDFELPPEINRLLRISNLTESGLVYFSGNVTGIINPLGIDNDSNPLAVIPRIWVSEENRHSDSQNMLANLLRQDCLEIEQQKEAGIKTGLTPKFDLSAFGQVYIMFQEGDTSTPYHMLAKAAKLAQNYYFEKGDQHKARIYDILNETLKYTQYDELAHRKMFKGLVEAALHGNSRVVSEDILSAIHYFTVEEGYIMPGGLFIEGYTKETVRINKSGLFTRTHHHSNVYRTLIKDLNILNLSDSELSKSGRQKWNEIVGYLGSLATKFPEIKNVGPAGLTDGIQITIDGQLLEI